MEKYKLKTTLENEKDKVVNKLASDTITYDERVIYNQWLQSLNTIIGVCKERNRY